MSKNNKIKIAILVGVGLLSIVTLMLSTDGGTQAEEWQNQAPVSLKKENFSYDEATEAYKKAKENGQLQNNTIGTNQPANDSAKYYMEENDPRIKKMQQHMQNLDRTIKGQNNPNQNSTVNQAPRPLTEAEKAALQRAELLRAREERLARSQDYSAPQQQATPSDLAAANFLEFRASIYRDQFILPGDRVTLILDEPVTYKGNVFKENTFIYANANLQGSRVLLNVTNIDHIPIALIAKDVRDGNVGMYSQRAGELWREFEAQAQTQGYNEVSNEVARQVNVPLVGPAIQAFGSFFRSKKYREKDKILLGNDDELILTTVTN